MGHGKGAGEASGEGMGKAIVSDCMGIGATLAFCSLCATKITIGAVYIYDCNLQPMIPIFLIVSGIAPIFLIGSGNRNKKESKFMAFLCGIIALLFNVAWTAAGSVWVYPTWGIMKTMGNVSCVANAMNCKSCNEAVLTFAFAMVTIDWIFLGLIIVYVTCLIYPQLNTNLRPSDVQIFKK